MFRRLEKTIFKQNYIFIDTEDGHGERILRANGLKSAQEMRNPKYAPFCIRFIKVPNKRAGVFIKCMETLRKNMLIMGQPYEKTAEDIFSALKIEEQ